MVAAQREISIVCPVYGCSQVLRELCDRAIAAVEPLGSYEIILVFDCSEDHSWETISNLASENVRIKALRLSRNFGQHHAIMAGLEHVNGKWVVVMDCDLQDRPEEIPALYTKATEGFEIVVAQRMVRRDSRVKRLASRAFYGMFGYMTDTPQDPTIGNYGIYHCRVVDAVLRMGDHLLYFPAMVKWVGFESTVLPVTHAAREYGHSSYSYRQLARLAANNIMGFSDKPLRLTVKIGALMSALSLGVAGFYLVRYMQGAITEPGYASLILSVWLLGSALIFIIGMVGLYVGHVFERVKSRPMYIVKDRLNFDAVSDTEP